MSEITLGKGLGLLGLLAVVAFHTPTSAQNPKGGEKKPDARAAAILGNWTSAERHIALANLYEPELGVRTRKGAVTFRREGDRLVGSGEGEAGSTRFRTVTFADDKLVFEFDIKWRKGAGPKAVVEGKQENKATVRVEAALRGERLVGKFGVYLADGTEAYRGEWEAVRAKESKEE